MATANLQGYTRGVLGHNRRMLAKTITLIESSLPSHQELAREVINLLLPYTGKAVRLGITGVPGAGDELQGMKKGIMELADAIAINKSDGDNVRKAKLAKRQYEMALHFLNPSSPNWTPPVLTCSALEMTGIDEVWGTVLDYNKKLTATGELEAKREKQNIDWMRFLVKEGLREWFYKKPYVQKMIPKIEKEVEQGTTAPTTAADKLLFSLNDN